MALKQLPRKSIGIITTLIHACIRNNYFPKMWKWANVVVLPKPGKDGKFPKNYRPISLISSIGKIAEAVILEELKKETEEKKILPNEQFGFRNNHSTAQQIIRIVEKIIEGFTTSKSTTAIFFDVEKAFDKVWHQGLIYKLISFGFHPNLIRIIMSYLKDRQFRVAIKEHISAWKPCRAGVPQGSLLSPLLFNIYIADITK